MSHKIEVVKLANSRGMELEVCNFGATLMSLKVPNRENELVNVVVGLENPHDYERKEFHQHNLYLGSSIGRYAGRISKGSFQLNGKEFSLASKDGVHLHGGPEGLDKKYWEVISAKHDKNPQVQMRVNSPHMEGGYPGNVEVLVQYELLESNALRILYKATTDWTTVLNLTNHAYYNLNGGDSILDHELQIHSTKVLELDKKKLPTGKMIGCSQTHYDFLNKTSVKNLPSQGLDDMYVLNPKPYSALLSSKKSGISMKVRSRQPAMVVFTPLQFPELDFLDYAKYSLFPAICFETQNFPDAPNHENFPSSVLRPDEVYSNETVLDFSTSFTN